MKTETKWSIDTAHSEIAFKVKHLMISNVRGQFREFDATVITNGNDFSSARIDLWINTASIDTAEKKRDEHLKSADFFDVEKYKQITFVSDSFERSEVAGLHELSGDLTIKGVTKKIRLDAEYGGLMKDPYGNEKAGFTINGKMNRKEWGLNWNAALEAGGVMVSDEVIITCEIELIKQRSA